MSLQNGATQPVMAMAEFDALVDALNSNTNRLEAAIEELCRSLIVNVDHPKQVVDEIKKVPETVQAALAGFVGRIDTCCNILFALTDRIRGQVGQMKILG